MGQVFGTNLAINAITGGVGAKLKGLKYLTHLKSPVTRFLAREGAEYALDVAATGTVNVALNDQGAGEAFGSAALGGILGRGVAHGLKGGWRGGRYLFDNYRVDWQPGFGTGFGALGEISITKDVRKYLVYSIRDDLERVLYVGRTSGFGSARQILKRRELRHRHFGKGVFQIEEIQTSYAANRGAEDVIFNRERLRALEEGRPLLNVLNPISNWNPRAKEYIRTWMDSSGDSE